MIRIELQATGQHINEEDETVSTTTTEVMDMGPSEDSRLGEATPQVMAVADPSIRDDDGGCCGLGSPRTAAAAAADVSGLLIEELTVQG